MLKKLVYKHPGKVLTFFRKKNSFQKIIIYALILTVSGLINSMAVYAANGYCDKQTFERFTLGPDGTTTFAITSKTYTWAEAKSIADSASARLAGPTDQKTQIHLFSNYSSAFTHIQSPFHKAVTPEEKDPKWTAQKAWIGLSDPLQSAFFCKEGDAGCTTPPDRFVWSDGATVGFSAWAEGEPNGFCASDEHLYSTDQLCGGEPWVAMNKDGSYSDEGDHYQMTPTKLKALVEWPNTKLDCVTSSLPPSKPIVIDLPNKGLGVTWCANGNALNLFQCLTTADGEGVCPEKKTECVLNGSGGYSCPIASDKKCHITEDTASCSPGFTYNTTHKRCESPPSLIKYTGTYSTTKSSPYICGYNMVKAWGVWYNIPIYCPGKTTSGYICNQGDTLVNDKTGECAKNSCSDIATLDTVTDVCVQTSGALPCECPPGLVFDPMTTKCSGTPSTKTFSKIAAGSAAGGEAICLDLASHLGSADYLHNAYSAKVISSSCEAANNSNTCTLYDKDGSAVQLPCAGSGTGGFCPNGVASLACEYKISFNSPPISLPSSGAGAGAPIKGCHFSEKSPGITIKTTPTFTLQITPSDKQCGDPDIKSPKKAYIHYQCGGLVNTEFFNEGVVGDVSCSTNDFVFIDGFYYSSAGTTLMCPTGTNPLNDEVTGQLALCQYPPVIGATPPPICGKHYCSPFDCADTTKTMSTADDPPPGGNDKGNDGVKDKDGNCLGQVYLFNGQDQRCRLFDNNAMVGSIAKLGAAVALACSGLGGMIAGYLGGLMGGVSATTQTVASAVISSILSTGVNTGIDAAMGNLNFNLIGAVASIAISGIGAYLGAAAGELSKVGDKISSVQDGVQSTTEVTQKFTGIKDIVSVENGNSTLASITKGLDKIDMGVTNKMVWVGSINDGVLTGVQQGVVTVAEKGADGLWSITRMAVEVKQLTPINNFINNLQDQLAKYTPAIEQGLLGSYKQTKCCYPDKMSGSCEKDEFSLNPKVEAGNCHIVGEYCSSDVLGLCMVKKQTYCCFSSILARIIHEQGRPTLASFFDEAGGWGSPKIPNCRGLTPDEFQALDFSSMDLSEYINSVNKNMQDTNYANKFNNYVKGSIKSIEKAIGDSDAYKKNAQ